MKFTIVYADNQRGIRRYCKHVLDAEGYRVLLAVDGDDALTVVETFAVDLVIIDERLPPCSGLKVAERIKEINPLLPVILFTKDNRQEALSKLQVDAMIGRSEDLYSLKVAIRELLPTQPGTLTQSVDSPPELDWIFDEQQSSSAVTAPEHSSLPVLEISRASADPCDGYQPMGV